MHASHVDIQSGFVCIFVLDNFYATRMVNLSEGGMKIVSKKNLREITLRMKPIYGGWTLYLFTLSWKKKKINKTKKTTFLVILHSIILNSIHKNLRELRPAVNDKHPQRNGFCMSSQFM